MGNIVAGFASSHAFTFVRPENWAEFRNRNRASYERRTGRPPTAPAELEAEDLAEVPARYENITSALNSIRARIASSDLDALIIVGDDQNENLSEKNMPQLAVYTGGNFRTGGHFGRGDRIYRSQESLARELLEYGVNSGFDIASLGAFDADMLTSHAHAQILDEIFHEVDIPVVMVFMNAVHHPAVPPKRCYRFGEMIAEAIRASETTDRVAVYASGGLSHYTAGYPWAAYRGLHGHGAIDVDFDREVVDLLRTGNGVELAKLSSADLLDHGQIELRAWIALAGALGDVRPDAIVYEPFFNAIQGMGVASWDPSVGS